MFMESQECDSLCSVVGSFEKFLPQFVWEEGENYPDLSPRGPYLREHSFLVFMHLDLG